MDATLVTQPVDHRLVAQGGGQHLHVASLPSGTSAADLAVTRSKQGHAIRQQIHRLLIG